MQQECNINPDADTYVKPIHRTGHKDESLYPEIQQMGQINKESLK